LRRVDYFEGQSEAVRDLYRFGFELTVRLYNRNVGLDRELLDGLLRSLDTCRAEWENAGTVPRAAVALLVDLPMEMMHEAEYYGEPERTAAREAAIAVWDKIQAAVQVSEPPEDWQSP
jgi:hypothetical protein